MSKSVPASMIESQTWSPPRYITTPSSNSPSNHTCYCGSNVKDDLSSIREDEKISIARHWLYDETMKLLKATTKPGLVLLSRTPGMGKTWLMKHLLRSTGASQPATARNDKCTTTIYAGSLCAFSSSPCIACLLELTTLGLNPNSTVVKGKRTFSLLASIIRVTSTKKSSYDWLKSHILSSHFCDCYQTNSCSLPDIIHSIIYRALEHPLLHAYRDVILREQHTRKAITLNACIQNVEHAFFTGND